MLRYSWFAALLMAGLGLGQDYSAPKPPINTAPKVKSSPRCPWLTEGSAVRALGGDVRVVVTTAGPAKGTCSFVRLDAPAGVLKIQVGPAGIPACPQGSEKVIGVGTRASRCRMPSSAAGSTEMISGAVRETGMAIILGRSKGDPRAKRDFLEELTEQVAGNLF